jgi:lysophospholipase L1-like esterase
MTSNYRLSDLSVMTNPVATTRLAALDPNDVATAPSGPQGSDKTIPFSAMYQGIGGSHSYKLQPWLAGLAGRETTRANVVILGDSLTVGQGATSFPTTYQQLLPVMLRSRFPTSGVTTGGRGFLPPILPPSNPTTFTPPYVSFTGATAAQLEAGVLYGYGPNLITFNLNVGSGAVLTYSLNGDAADIVWAGSSGNGTFSYQVDSGGVTNVSTNVTFGVNYVTHVSLGSAGAHTLKISYVSGTNVFVTGVIEYNGDYTTGIQVHNCGFSGTTTSNWTVANSTNIWPSALSVFNPNLIVIELGANDNASSITPATTAANISDMVSNIRTNFTGLSLLPPPILLLAVYNAANDGPTTPAQWQQYVNAMYGIAAGDSAIDVFDLSMRMPSTGAANTYNLYAGDGIHPVNAGHRMITDALGNYLGPA